MQVIIVLAALVAAVAADGYAPAPYKQSHHQPSYKQSYHQPSYKQSHYQPSYQQPSYKPSYQPSYQQPSYKPSYNKPSYHQESYSYAPTEYYYDVPAYDYYGGHANTYVNRQPYSVHYDLNEYGGYGSTHYVNFDQTFGQSNYKGYH